MEYRIEHDSMGEMKVPADRLWAAQTQRSHENFKIGVDIETMPREITHAFGILKKAAALALMLLIQFIVYLPSMFDKAENEHRALPFFEYVITGMERNGLDKEKNADDLYGRR